MLVKNIGKYKDVRRFPTFIRIPHGITEQPDIPLVRSIVAKHPDLSIVTSRDEEPSRTATKEVKSEPIVAPVPEQEELEAMVAELDETQEPEPEPEPEPVKQKKKRRARRKRKE